MWKLIFSAEIVECKHFHMTPTGVGFGVSQFDRKTIQR